MSNYWKGDQHRPARIRSNHIKPRKGPHLRSTRPIVFNDDILSQILLWVSAENFATSYDHWDWVVVVRVSRQWHKVATDSPEIWSYINQWRSLKRTKRFLQLSKDADLTIDFHNQGPTQKAESYGMERHLELILKEMHRIRTLQLSLFSSWKGSLLHLLGQKAPRLRKLEYNSADLTTELNVPAPQTSEALRHMQLDHVTLLPSVLCLKNLTELFINQCGVINVPDLLCGLRNSPNLKTLYLEWCNFSFVHGEANTLQSLELNHLDYLNIQVIKFSDCTRFVQYLAFPNGLPHWDITCENALTEKDIPKLQALSPLAIHRFHVEKVCIYYHNNLLHVLVNDLSIWKCKNFDGAAGLSLKFKKSVPANSIYLSMLQLFKNALCTANHVNIEDFSNKLTKETLYQILCGITSARRVSIRFDRRMNGEEECLKAFVHRYSQSPDLQDKIIPCPKMEHLFLWCPYEGQTDGFFTHLEQAVKARSEQGLQIQKLELQHCERKSPELSGIRRWVKELQFTVGWTHYHRESDSDE